MSVGPVYAEEKFKRALALGHYMPSMLAARDVPTVALEDAATLTIMAAERDPDRFPEMARRLLARIAVEIRPPLDGLVILAQCFADVGVGALHPNQLAAPLERAIAGERLG